MTANLSKSIFELMLGIMKNQLKLAEFRFGGKDSDSFKFFKEQTMNNFYEDTKKFYQKLSKEDIFEPCSCGATIRHGWQDCIFCCGSGWKDK